MRSITWPIVGVAAVSGGVFLGAIALTPADQPELRSALIGVLVTTTAAATTRYLGPRVERIESQVVDANAKLDEVGEKVNGRITQLIEALRAAERRAALAEADVSRETSHRERSNREDPNT